MKHARIFLIVWIATAIVGWFFNASMWDKLELLVPLGIYFILCKMSE